MVIVFFRWLELLQLEFSAMNNFVLPADTLLFWHSQLTSLSK